MELTNKYGCRPELYNLVVHLRSLYSSGDSDFSATSLIKPSRIYALEKKYKDILTEDVRDVMKMAMGTLVHSGLEAHALPGAIVEKRFFIEVDGYKISAQIDNLTDGVLTDWKTSKSTAFVKSMPAKKEYEAQLNVQLECLRQNGLDAHTLLIEGVLLDHDVMRADDDNKYPYSPWATQTVKMWPREKTISFISERIKSHKVALEELPLCKPSDVWGGKRCKYFCQIGKNKLCSQFEESKNSGRITRADALIKELNKERKDEV